jgi:hypothetical protein
VSDANGPGARLKGGVYKGRPASIDAVRVRDRASAPRPSPRRSASGGRRTIGCWKLARHSPAVSVSTTQQPRQRLAVEEPEIAQIPAIALDQIEGVEDCDMGSRTAAQLIESRQAVRPTASPSIVKLAP